MAGPRLQRRSLQAVDGARNCAVASRARRSKRYASALEASRRLQLLLVGELCNELTKPTLRVPPRRCGGLVNSKQSQSSLLCLLSRSTCKRLGVRSRRGGISQEREQSTGGSVTRVRVIFSLPAADYPVFRSIQSLQAKSSSRRRSERDLGIKIVWTTPLGGVTEKCPRERKTA